MVWNEWDIFYETSSLGLKVALLTVWWIYALIEELFRRINSRKCRVIQLESTNANVNANRIVTMILINLNVGKLTAHINWIAKQLERRNRETNVLS